MLIQKSTLRDDNGSTVQLLDELTLEGLDGGYKASEAYGYP